MSGLSITDLITNTANANGVPAGIALAVAEQESGLDPSATGSKGEQGIFQLMPSTAAALGVTNGYDPVQNVMGGIAYLKQLFDEFGDWTTALAAYNWGPGNVATYGAGAAPASTQMYVANALASAGAAAPPSPSGASAASTDWSGGGTSPAAPSADTSDGSYFTDTTGLPDTGQVNLNPLFLLVLAGLAVFFGAQLFFAEAD